MSQFNNRCDRASPPNLDRNMTETDVVQHASGNIEGIQRTIRFATVEGVSWVHAVDLCLALGWKRPAHTLDTVQNHIELADNIGIQRGCKDDRFICRAGSQALFTRRTGGVTQRVRDLIMTKVFQEDSGYESEEPMDQVEQDEPMMPSAEVASMEQLAHHRAEASLMTTQAITARANVLQLYQAMGGDIRHPDYEASRATLLDEMRRPFASQFIGIAEYIQSQGFPEEAALQLAGVFGPDMKRAYRAERGRDPLTYVAVYPGTTSNVCIYDRYADCELLGSCWRNFQRHRAWFTERISASTQRMVDQRHLNQMSQAGSKPAPGWGAAKTQASVGNRPVPF